MNMLTIVFSNVTMAMKAQNALKLNGIRGEVRKNAKTSNTGCTFSLKVNGDINNIKGILNKYNIEYLQILKS